MSTLADVKLFGEDFVVEARIVVEELWKRETRVSVWPGHGHVHLRHACQRVDLTRTRAPERLTNSIL